MPPTISLEDKIKKYTLVRNKDVCWPWLGGTKRDPNGTRRAYVKLPLTKRYVTAARAILLVQGLSLSRIDFACHTCDNAMCVNPAHIYKGTPQSNMQDAIVRGRMRYPGAPRRISGDTIAAIKKALKAGEVQRVIAGRHKVSPAYITLIKQGKCRADE